MKSILRNGVNPLEALSSDILFREVQYFRRPWFLIVIFSITALIWYAFIAQVIIGIPFGDNLGTDGLLWFLLITFGIIFPALLLWAHLTIEVRTDGIWLQFFPFHRRMWRIGREEIHRHESMTYRVLRDFGGWGIRYGSLGTGYNVSGNKGVMLYLARNQTITIGSQKVEEFDQAVERMLKR
jgi:hypothetical protein